MPVRCVVFSCSNLAHNVAKGISLHRISFSIEETSEAPRSKTQKKAMDRLGLIYTIPDYYRSDIKLIYLTKLIKNSKYDCNYLNREILYRDKWDQTKKHTV